MPSSLHPLSFHEMIFILVIIVLSNLRGSRLTKLPSGLSSKEPNPRVKLLERLATRAAAVVRERGREGGSKGACEIGERREGWRMCIHPCMCMHIVCIPS